MIVTNHEMEIIELLRDEINYTLKRSDIINHIAHDPYYTKRILMSLRCKDIIDCYKVSIDKEPAKFYVTLKEEYR